MGRGPRRGISTPRGVVVVGGVVMTRTLVIVIDATNFGTPGRACRAFYANGAKQLMDDSFGDELARMRAMPGTVDLYVEASPFAKWQEHSDDYRWALAECDDVVVVRCWGAGEGATVHVLQDAGASS